MNNTRYYIDWPVLDRKIKREGMTPASLSRAIGRTSSFYTAMKRNNSKVLRKDALSIANVLRIHGITKFTTESKQTEASDKSIIPEIQFRNDPETEAEVMTRIADALERIANALEGRSEPWQLSL